ncbi:GTPase [Nocardiopsis salina]|uniref:GTPase n=1 Tax=Nocardiopsis salina TaxID=245836 RepID=UPI00034CEA4A|nr:GTPase [Nocardiopsis salina]
MTTQWNPAGHQGEPGADGNGNGNGKDAGAGTDRVAQHGSDAQSPAADPDPAPERADAEPDPGPWRVYTMPVPEHPDHSGETGTESESEEPGYDGITGYPAPAGPGGPGEQPQPRSTGRHARPAGPGGGPGPESGDDDPDGLAGWVGSLTDAADDARIAGRSTGSFPAVSGRDAAAAQPGAEDSWTETVRPEGRSRSRSGSTPAEGSWTETVRPWAARPEDSAARAGGAGPAGSTGAAGTGAMSGTGSSDGVHEGPWVTGGGDAGATGVTGTPVPSDTSETTGGQAAGRPDTPVAANGAHETTGPTGANGTAEPAEPTGAAGRDASGSLAAEGGRSSGDSAGDLLADDPDGSDGAAVSAASAVSDASAQDSGGAERGPDEPEPLPHRVPGTSPMSGAFRAVSPDDSATGDLESASDPDGDSDDRSDAGSDEHEYRPTNHDTWRPARTSTREELVERLDALGSLHELGEGELPSHVTERSTQLLEHAGARLNLSGDHTVVALAGGTGSGKSSLFNALCGLELSQTGITRPTTSKAHACVWGHEGADELLGWLGVPERYRHSRTGVLDSGNSEMNGLVLLDLPDHDSVRSMHTAEADRLIGSVDLLVWVLDPQKYADAAVHHRYLAKMAGHGAVTVAVLNQVDRVGNDELEELLTDLRRLLESESGVHPRIVTTSTTIDQGVDDLRDFLVETVHERRALVDRLDADLDVVIGDFEPFRGEGEIPTTVSAEVRSSLQNGLSNAAGVSAVADVTEANDVRRGRRRVGWPVARRLAKLRKDPLAAVQLDFVRRDTENGVSGRVDAHEAELEKSLVEAADSVSEGMPSMWRRRLRAAARSGVGELPTELGETVDAAVRGSERTPSWWGFARLVQYVLLGVAGVGAAWALVSAVSWTGGGITGLRMFDDPVFIAYSGAVVAASLVVGWLTGVGCGNLVEVAAVQRREEIERTADASLRETAGERVVRPLEAELERFRSFRRAYETARGPAGDGSEHASGD